jgi:NAD(P)H-dependent flavin oxidoreductase YrpB (nitropropane dioxygenase family)
MPTLDTRFARQVGIEVPLICGAMYPCSNPELIAAVSAAGGIGIIQPISMSFVHKRELREGIRWIRTQTDRPIGFEVSERINQSPARKSWPWTNVSETGCTMPMPPASEAAATSSGLLHGYMAPQISGTSMPACRVSGVPVMPRGPGSGAIAR